MDDITRVFQLAEGKWKGCDWPTCFGKAGIDLSGLKASQARLMARATSGSEADDWHAAADWLAKVENDAQTAEREAAIAAELACLGDFTAARDHADRACALEKKYRQTAVWQGLYDILQVKVDRLGRARSNGVQPGHC
jgi:hypothetical protein